MTPLCFANPSPPSGWTGDFHPQAIEHAGHTTKPLRGSARREPLTFSSCVPPFAAVTLTLEDGAFSTAWRRAMATGFLSLFYLTFIPVVFFPSGDPLMPKSGFVKLRPYSEDLMQRGSPYAAVVAVLHCVAASVRKMRSVDR